MVKQHLFIRALRCATIALFLAAGLEGLRQVVLPGLSAWQSQAVAMLCASVVFLLTFGLLWRRQVHSDRLKENVFEDIVKKLPEIACVLDEAGRLKHWNSNFETVLGYTAPEIAKITAFDAIAEQQRVVVQQTFAAVLTAGMAKVESVLIAKDGTQIACLLTGVRIVLNEQPCILGVAVDLRKLRQAEQTLAAIVEFSEDAIIGKTVEGVITSWNRAAERIYGYTTAEAVGRNVSFLLPPERQAEVQAILLQVRNGQAIESFETQRITKAGAILDVSVSISPIKDAWGQIIGASTIARDNTARRVAEERIKFLAYYDALTGLPNRSLLQDRLTTVLAAARRRKNKVALLFLDLDQFKLINDSLGHAVGDLLLQEVAKRLKSWPREQDTVARLGGDEFLIVLTDLKNIPDVAIAAERLMDAMTAEFVIQDHPLNISCSLGISIFPEHGADLETLIKNADAAMYSAKQNGRNNFQFFTDNMNAQVVERVTLENCLRLALEKKELFLMYQPQMDMVTGAITGFEALLRWQNPDFGLVPPIKFIPIAENCGLIPTIGEWVLRTACSQVRKWQEEGLPAVQVAVNVSAVQFRQEGFCDLITRVLQETGLAPQYLELELTESLLLADADVTFSVMKKLKAIGVTLAIDDFGIGYSSFSYLRQFQASKLKIDRSFIRDVAVNPDDAAITAAIISMAKSLRLKVIAEGVEDEAQMSFLRSHQCDGIQGYYFSKPLSAEMTADKLRGTPIYGLSASVGLGLNDHK
jgi:diguanylate cyclase (GGDEF)-like protein/PAS domain S-box-containing protein